MKRNLIYHFIPSILLLCINAAYPAQADIVKKMAERGLSFKRGEDDRHFYGSIYAYFGNNEEEQIHCYRTKPGWGYAPGPDAPDTYYICERRAKGKDCELYGGTQYCPTQDRSRDWYPYVKKAVDNYLQENKVRDAIKSGSIEQVKSVIEPLPREFFMQVGPMALNIAIELKQHAILDYLISKGANPTRGLAQAAAKKDDGMLDYLVQKGANLNAAIKEMTLGHKIVSAMPVGLGQQKQPQRSPIVEYLQQYQSKKQSKK